MLTRPDPSGTKANPLLNTAPRHVLGLMICLFSAGVCQASSSSLRSSDFERIFRMRCSCSANFLFLSRILPTSPYTPPLQGQLNKSGGHAFRQMLCFRASEVKLSWKSSSSRQLADTSTTRRSCWHASLTRKRDCEGTRSLRTDHRRSSLGPYPMTYQCPGGVTKKTIRSESEDTSSLTSKPVASHFGLCPRL